MVPASVQDLKGLGGVENETEPCVWTFHDEEGEIIGFVLLYVDDALVACVNNRKGKTLREKIQGLYQWGTWDTKVFTQYGAKITQAYDQQLQQWGDFTVSMEDYASEVQLINLSPTRRRQTEQKVTPYEQAHAP